MAWTIAKHIENVINKAEHFLQDVKIIQHDEDIQRAIIALEGKWQNYRVVIQEIHRVDGTIRYAYCLLNEANKQLYRFDNSGDRLAIKLRYKADWKKYQHAEIPHQHDPDNQVTLTNAAMTFEDFLMWLSNKME